MMKTSISPLPAMRRLAAAAVLCCAAAAPAFAYDDAALNFVGADIESVIKALGHYTGTTFVIDPRVKGSLTVTSEKPVTKAQAYALLTSALRLQGYAVVPSDGFAKVVPEADAKLQSGPVKTVGSAETKGDQVVTQIFHLNYESAINLTAVLRPLISANNTVNANPGNNSLVITDYADNMKRMAQMIAALDVPGTTDVDVVSLKYAIAGDLAAMVTKLMENTNPGETGKVSVLADARTNSLLLRGPSAARVAMTRALINKLDQQTAQAGNVHVVPLKNADALSLAATLRAVMSGDSSSLPTRPTGTQGGSVTGSVSGQSSTASGQQTNQQSGAQGNAQQQVSQAAGGGAGYIQADVATNTLIITANEAVYRNLRSVIDQLDTRRAQVYLEALVVEVNATKASEFGIQWMGISGDKQSDYRVGAAQTFNATGSGSATNSLLGLAAGAGKVAPGAGLSVGIFRQIEGKLGLGAIIHAMESDGNANVLSTPHTMTIDNELASLKIGKNVPIISGQFTTASGGSNANPFQTIDRRDVGMILKVRPQISEGGTIKLAIYNESSSVDASSVNSASGVTINTRTFESNVIAEDGQIMVLGGLIEDTEGDGVEKVGGLGDLPLIGNLFKYQTRGRKKTNLMVFLRPVIVRDKSAGQAIAMDRYDYMRSEGGKAAPNPDVSLLKDFGSPVLPKLENGQPAGNEQFAKMPPAVVAPKPAQQQ